MAFEHFRVSTKHKIEILNITGDVRRFKKISEGLLVVSTPHTTARLMVNEYEPNLIQDYVRFYGELSKFRWAHNLIDNNAESHLVASLKGPSLLIPVEGGELMLGTWQSIIFVELDGPREREVRVYNFASLSRQDTTA